MKRFLHSSLLGKSALDRMTADMSEELRSGGKSLSVISIWPGFVRTEHMLKYLSSSNDSFPLDVKTQCKCSLSLYLSFPSL